MKLRVTDFTAHGQSDFWSDAAQWPQSDAATSWVVVALRAGLTVDQVEFLAALPNATAAVATKSMLVIEHGDKVAQQLTAGKETPR